MAKKVRRRLTPAKTADVKLKDGFWGPKVDKNRSVTVPLEYEQCKKSGRIDAFRLNWKAGKPNRPHLFWDSDVAKWIEAAAYCLSTRPSPDLERHVLAYLLPEQDDRHERALLHQQGGASVTANRRVARDR